MVFQTDKSGRFSEDSMENYKVASHSHTANDEIITEKDNEKLQTVINSHAESWVHMLSAGSETGNETRIKNNMTA